MQTNSIITSKKGLYGICARWQGSIKEQKPDAVILPNFELLTALYGTLSMPFSPVFYFENFQT